MQGGEQAGLVVVGVGGGLIIGVFHRGAIAVRVVDVGGDVVLRVLDRIDKAGRVIRDRGDVVQRIGDGGEFAERVVAELRDASRSAKPESSRVVTRRFPSKGDVYNLARS